MLSLGIGSTLLTTKDVPKARKRFRDLYSDTWVATDALGRALPSSTEAPAPRKNRFVGIFYFIWHGAHGTPGPYDNTKLIAANPSHPDYGPEGAFHWWGEPAVGYFLANDPWVIRHNIAMLQAAGVDVLLFDVTNAFTYPDEVHAFCQVAMRMREQGNATPQIAYVTHAAGAETVTSLYNNFYSKNLYPDLWFYWEGKPLILGDISAKLPGGSPIDPHIRDYFTWRYSWAWDPGQDKWQWIDSYPQRYGWHTNPNVAEEVPVSIASHPVNDIGRSFHNGAEPPLNRDFIAADVKSGPYFNEQLEQALKLDPDFLFITGWNEWVAQRFIVKPGQQMNFMGRALKPGDTFFVDNYNEEFSRDAMPMKGGYGDTYYLQMVSGIRRFKGVRPIPIARGFHTMPPASQFAAWQKITPEYRDDIGDVIHRDWKGWGDLHYRDDSGRNDIVLAKVACDQHNLFFYARTAQPLSPHTDPNWMLLLINSDLNYSNGWHGFDYVVNQRVIGATTTTVKNISSGNEWEVKYRATGNQMVIEVPRAILKLDNGRRTVFDFHWVDNCPIGGDINDLWYIGDSAPAGRFNYRFIHETV